MRNLIPASRAIAGASLLCVAAAMLSATPALAHGGAGKLGGRGDDLRLVARAVGEAPLMLHGPRAVVLNDSEDQG